jgi:hypothetical protein
MTRNPRHDLPDKRLVAPQPVEIALDAREPRGDGLVVLGAWRRVNQASSASTSISERALPELCAMCASRLLIFSGRNSW